MLIILALAYLQKVPKEYFCTYVGQEDPVSCKPKDFCDNPDVLSYEPNWDREDSYNNWITRFDLHCASNSKIGLIGSSYFSGWALTLTFLPRLSDLFGRQKIMFTGTAINFLAYSMLLSTHSYTILIVSMATFGMMSTVRVQVGVNYMYESVNRSTYTTLYMIIAMGEGFIGVLASLYFMFVSKTSFWLTFIGWTWIAIAMVSSWFYPESPRYLIKSG